MIEDRVLALPEPYVGSPFKDRAMKILFRNIESLEDLFKYPKSGQGCFSTGKAPRASSFPLPSYGGGARQPQIPQLSAPQVGEN